MIYYANATRTKLTNRLGRAFSLVEVLVVIGLILVLLSLAIPGLAGVRRQAREISALSSIRTMGQGLHQYATDSMDLVPAFLPKTSFFIRQGGKWPEVLYRNIRLRGGWFDHSALYHLAFSPLLPWGVNRAPGAPNNLPSVTIDGVRSAYYTDFRLSDSFYAEPSYWEFGRQRGPEQWGAQRLISVAFPSRKALLWQTRSFPGPGGGVELGFLGNVPGAILWADQSASEEVLRKLREGGPVNHFHPGIGSPAPADARGLPVRDTEHGILGVDR